MSDSRKGKWASNPPPPLSPAMMLRACKNLIFLNLYFIFKKNLMFFFECFSILSRECNSRALLPPRVFPNGDVLAVRHTELFIATGVRFSLRCSSSLHYVHILSFLFVRHWNCFCHRSVSVNFCSLSLKMYLLSSKSMKVINTYFLYLFLGNCCRYFCNFV